LCRAREVTVGGDGQEIAQMSQFHIDDPAGLPGGA
jgi:hypothetical protein